MPGRRRPLLFALLALALLGASVAVARSIQVGADRPYDVKLVPAARTLRWLSLGHPTLAANLLWLEAVQYMGDARADERGWEKLRPLVDVVTDLDPRHGYAYQTTGIMLSSAGRLSDSNAILEKGTRNVPERYILPFHRAVNAFMYAGDYAEAGRWFEVAARAPGAPTRMRDYVLSMYVQGDTAEAALSFLRRVEEEAQDDESRRALQLQIKRATLERDAGRIERAAARYRRLVGVQPVALEQLAYEGLLRPIPQDPFGGTYYFDEEWRIRSTVYEKRIDRAPSGPERAVHEGRERVHPVVESNR
jgi:tetratricopeptide (TPR) repeat protein